MADEEGIGGRENQGGAEVPIADGCGVERGGGVGQGEGEHAPGEEQGRKRRLSMGQGVAASEGGGELWPRPDARQFLDGLPDGPVAYHYPASDYQVDLFQGES